MFEEVKEQVMGRRKGGMNSLKERQRRSRWDKPQSCQAGAEQKLPLPGEDSGGIDGIAELRVHMLPTDKVKWRGKIRQSLAPGGRRRGGQEQGSGGIAAEMLSAGPEQGAQGALGNKLAAALLPNMSSKKT